MAYLKVTMNEYIHPRNPYQRPPDFKALAQEFPEIQPAISAEDGKFDFGNRKNSVLLAKCLLKKDFNLNIQFPDNSLSPSLTLKLNYLLWIEDLLEANSLISEGNVTGIDVGCGGAILFPALASRHLGWTMIGTESHENDVKVAQANIGKNDLKNKVEVVVNNDANRLFDCVFSDKSKTATFTMCNPPFYDEDEYKEQLENDSEAAGRRHEMTCSGGEMAFVDKMISESILLSNKVKIFTTMLGHKRSLAPLKNRLKFLVQNVKFNTTEFCQGKTMRWALCWTFDDAVDLDKVKSTFAVKKAAKKAAEPFLIAAEFRTSFKQVFDKIRELVTEDLNAKSIDSCGEACLSFQLFQPSWRNQRAKRRKLAKGEVDVNAEVSDVVLLDVVLDVLHPEKNKVVLKFSCHESSSLGRGGLYELVQYFRNKLIAADL